ncbi:hypothetical protein BT96DRAFT_1006875 [Gymnopus androsaceus JB14]|uniref:RING-14 protein n=1 Tax=Gymnopus androsaceus JB14 TaxID=1447944 RepID=A0A6A4GJV4_9AGAR|nr:hypothetical protein BT96DRAFT_1006875 [Gymnopus androsaceus JB14]
MHFSKTYTKLLLDLPPELRENAIQYRQLKKLINQVVSELDALGLQPAVLHELLEFQGAVDGKGKQKEGARPNIVYEFNSNSGKIEPRLRLNLSALQVSDIPSDSEANLDVGTEYTPGVSLLWALQRKAAVQDWEEDSSQIIEVTENDEESHPVKHPIIDSDSHGAPRELVIPLVKDSAFFELLSTALHDLSGRLSVLYTDFTDTLQALSVKIADSARPVSANASNFHPHSILSHPGTISFPSRSNKSDLSSWREIFQLYIESEVFQSLNEVNAGERPIAESEKRLKLFAERITSRGLGDKRKLKLKQSHEALQSFLELNMFILNVKKLEQANAEATRKILKKHAKRTALPLPLGEDYFSREMALIPHSNGSSFASLARVLVQALGETLIPIIPSVDDYSCIICTNIAFKPIRLGCGHLFCVRCLVKMQKRGQGHCPMCRAPTVLVADRSNVDWALMNFMEDWFPEEAHIKLKESEKEATEEHLIEMGFDPNQKCVIM